MKLLLHIGSYKTASTSMQYFFSINRHLLMSQGLFYPKNPNSVFVSNELASQLSLGNDRKISQFLMQARKQAEKHQCQTVLISAEFLFGMTSFLLDLKQQPRAFSDFWKNEAGFN